MHRPCQNPRSALNRDTRSGSDVLALAEGADFSFTSRAITRSGSCRTVGGTEGGDEGKEGDSMITGVIEESPAPSADATVGEDDVAGMTRRAAAGLNDEAPEVF